MLAKVLRTHSLYNCAGYILSYINIVYKPRNIPVQVKDGCRILIQTIVFIEHFNVKEILLHGLYNLWKTFLLVYRPSTVHPLCHDAAYESCGASSRALHAFQHPPIERDVLYPVRRVTKMWFSWQRNQHLRRISLIT